MSSRRFYQILAILLLLTLASIVYLQLQERDSQTQAEYRKDPSGAASPVHVVSSPRQSREMTADYREADKQLKAEGVVTDAALKEFPRKAYQHLPSPAGKAAGAPEGEAYIHVPSAGRRVAMDANQIGEFPSIDTLVRETVGVRLMLGGVKPGTPVRVVILDGGAFPDSEGFSRLMEVSDWRGVAFEYTTSSNIGTHRILVEAVGHPKRIIDFNAFESTNS